MKKKIFDLTDLEVIGYANPKMKNMSLRARLCGFVAGARR
jgi:hypothetical protein